MIANGLGQVRMGAASDHNDITDHCIGYCCYADCRKLLDGKIFSDRDDVEVVLKYWSTGADPLGSFYHEQNCRDIFTAVVGQAQTDQLEGEG